MIKNLHKKWCMGNIACLRHRRRRACEGYLQIRDFKCGLVACTCGDVGSCKVEAWPSIVGVVIACSWVGACQVLRPSLGSKKAQNKANGREESHRCEWWLIRKSLPNLSAVGPSDKSLHSYTHAEISTTYAQKIKGL